MEDAVLRRAEVLQPGVHVGLGPAAQVSRSLDVEEPGEPLGEVRGEGTGHRGPEAVAHQDEALGQQRVGDGGHILHRGLHAEGAVGASALAQPAKVHRDAAGREAVLRLGPVRPVTGEIVHEEDGDAAIALRGRHQPPRGSGDGHHRRLLVFHRLGSSPVPRSEARLRGPEPIRVNPEHPKPAPRDRCSKYMRREVTRQLTRTDTTTARAAPGSGSSSRAGSL